MYDFSEVLLRSMMHYLKCCLRLWFSVSTPPPEPLPSIWWLKPFPCVKLRANVLSLLPLPSLSRRWFLGFPLKIYLKSQSKILWPQPSRWPFLFILLYFSKQNLEDVLRLQSQTFHVWGNAQNVKCSSRDAESKRGKCTERVWEASGWLAANIY